MGETCSNFSAVVGDGFIAEPDHGGEPFAFQNVPPLPGVGRKPSNHVDLRPEKVGPAELHFKPATEGQVTIG